MGKVKHFLIVLIIIVFPFILLGQPGKGNGNGGGNGNGPGGGNGNDPCLKPNPPASCVPIDGGIIWLGIAGGLLGFYYKVYKDSKDKASSIE